MPVNSGRVRAFLGAVALMTCAISISLVTAEVVLRLAPSLIPILLLGRMPPALSREIALRRGLPVPEKSMVRIERDDSGPALWISGPNSMRYMPATSPDLSLGALETHYLDAQGFCNTDVPAVATLLTLGDSFTWCTAVAPGDTWASKLESLLETEVYNVSSPGAGIHEYVQLFKRFGITRKPSIAMLGVYGGNDLRDALQFLEMREGVVQKPDPRTVRFLPETKIEDKWHSYAVNSIVHGLDAFVIDRIRSTLSERNQPGAVDFGYTIAAGGRSYRMNSENTDLGEINNARRVIAGKIDIGALWQPPLSEFVAICRSRSILPVILYIPSAYRAYRETVVFDDEYLREPLNGFNSEQIEFLERFAKEEGISFFDLSEPLAEAAETESRLLYFPGNLHLTRDGHAVIAKTLQRWLSDFVERATAKEQVLEDTSIRH